MCFQIADLIKYRGAGLAPMAGVTDAAMRLLCFEMGAAWAVSEMLSAKGWIYSGGKNEATRQLLKLLPEVYSLDAPLQEEEDGNLQSLIEDENSARPFEALVREEMSRTLEELLGKLTPRQQQVLRLHYGLEEGKCLSLEEISGILGVSKERVRQIERQAMDKLQKLGADLGLEDFLT